MFVTHQSNKNMDPFTKLMQVWKYWYVNKINNMIIGIYVRKVISISKRGIGIAIKSKLRNYIEKHVLALIIDWVIFVCCFGKFNVLFHQHPNYEQTPNL